MYPNFRSEPLLHDRRGWRGQAPSTPATTANDAFLRQPRARHLHVILGHFLLIDVAQSRGAGQGATPLPPQAAAEGRWQQPVAAELQEEYYLLLILLGHLRHPGFSD